MYIQHFLTYLAKKKKKRKKKLLRYSKDTPTSLTSSECAHACVRLRARVQNAVSGERKGHVRLVWLKR